MMISDILSVSFCFSICTGKEETCRWTSVILFPCFVLCVPGKFNLCGWSMCQYIDV